MTKPLNIFFRLSKVDVKNRLVYGIATAEVADQSGEVCDYETTVPYYKAWSARIEKASAGKSLGNLRAMHGNVAAGKLTQIDYNDDAKEIAICAKIVDDDEWKKVEEGVYTGFSHGGRYVKTWRDPNDKTLTRYTADPSEISIVDSPCLQIAIFEVVKADGTSEMRKFNIKEEPDTMSNKQKADELKQVWLSKNGKTYDTKREAEKANDDHDAAQLADDAAAPVKKIIDDMNATLDKASSGDDDKDSAKDDPKEGDDKDDKKDDAPADDKKAKKSQAVLDKLEEFTKFSMGEVFDAAQAMDILRSLVCLLWGEEAEALESSDSEDAAQVASLREAIDKIKAFIMSELMEVEDAEKAAEIGKLRKLLENPHLTDEGKAPIQAKIEQLEKAGARHSKGDMERLDAMHGHVKKMSKAMDGMHECMKGLGFGAEGAKGDDAAKGDLAEALQKSQANEAAMSKAFEGMQSMLEALKERLEKVENEPAPPKGSVFAVEKKGHDSTQAGKSDAEAKPLNPMPSGLSPEQARQRAMQ